jgi:hypothetical protein
MSSTGGKPSPFDSGQAGLVRTAWRLRAWWLTRVRGYRLMSVSRAPHSNFLGQVIYTRWWTVAAPQAIPTEHANVPAKPSPSACRDGHSRN